MILVYDAVGLRRPREETIRAGGISHWRGAFIGSDPGTLELCAPNVIVWSDIREHRCSVLPQR